MTLFPMFMKLEGRSCLVVGAGTIGEPKIQSLLASGASVRVVAFTATAAVAQWAETGAITWEARAFNASDLDGVFLVIAATNSRDVNATIFREAGQRNILCNVVDDPEYCDFYYPAVVRGESFSLPSRPTAIAPRWRKGSGANWKSSLVRSMASGWSSWARSGSNCLPARSTPRSAAGCCTNWPAARPSKERGPTDSTAKQSVWRKYHDR